MSIYSKDKSIVKNIRISPSENDNWDVNRIHDFLSGINSSSDSIEVNKLKSILKAYHLLFEKNIKHIMESVEMTEFIMNHDEFNQITEVL